jgi:hypothetical protein
MEDLLKIYIDGEEVPEAELVRLRKAFSLLAYKDECNDIGFKSGSEGHANCVLELIKINAQSTTPSSTGSYTNVQELIELKIKREKQYQTDRKIEEWKELLDYGYSFTD